MSKMHISTFDGLHLRLNVFMKVKHRRWLFTTAYIAQDEMKSDRERIRYELLL